MHSQKQFFMEAMGAPFAVSPMFQTNEIVLDGVEDERGGNENKCLQKSANR